MPDIPHTPTSKLDVTLSKLMKASQAVRTGIATHAEKHEVSRTKQREKIKAERQLLQSQEGVK